MAYTVGVLALQGGFAEHLTLLRRASLMLEAGSKFQFIEVRNVEHLSRCSALIIPGGESTTMSLVAAQLGLLEPLRKFIKTDRKPTWGTCAGLIMLAEEANATKKGGQELIGGLDVRVHRNHFGRQIESFETSLTLPFLCDNPAQASQTSDFPAVFIRAPVVEKILEHDGAAASSPVEVLAVLPGRADGPKEMTPRPGEVAVKPEGNAGDIVAVQQGNVFGTSFHPELTDDARIHVWWLRQVDSALG